MKVENLYTPNSMRTFTGRYVNLLDPKPDTIYPIDIAVGLARLCRFAGHTKKFFSVAQHSIDCMMVAEMEYSKIADLPFKMLLHDAHEYILGDVASPLKSLLTDYEIIASRLQHVIHQKFGVIMNDGDAAVIKEIDRRVLENEWQNKVLNFNGQIYVEKDVVDLWIHYFTKLCNATYTIY